MFGHEEVDTPTSEQSVVASQEILSDSVESVIVGQQDDQDNSQLLESSENEHNSTSDINNHDAGGVLPKTMKDPKVTVSTEGVRSVLSEKEDGSLGMQPARSKRTRKSRRSIRPEPATSTEDTDSTVTEEETPAVTGRARRSRMSGAPSTIAENLDIQDVQDRESRGGMDVSDIDKAESSDILSQGSAAPETGSDSQEGLSESLVSSSETETAPAGPRQGKVGRGRKRKQESTEMEGVVPRPPTRKTRREAAETEGSVFTERVSEGSKNVEYENISMETPVVNSQEEGKKVVSESLKIETSPEIEGNGMSGILTNRRQTRKSAQKSQEPELPQGSITSRQAEASSNIAEEDEAMDVGSNRRSRRSAPRNISQGANKPSVKRQTRTSLQLISKDSDLADTEHVVFNDKASERDSRGDDETPANEQLSVEQKNVEADTSHEDEGKITRRTRAARKSSVSTEDASVNTVIDILSSRESDSFTSEEVSGRFQTNSHDTPVVPKVKTPNSDTSNGEEAEKTPKTRKSRKSLDVKEVQLSPDPVTAAGTLSSRRSQRQKSTPSLPEATTLLQDSAKNFEDEEHIEDEESLASPKKVSRKTAPMKSTETVTKRVTRSRQKK